MMVRWHEALLGVYSMRHSCSGLFKIYPLVLRCRRQACVSNGLGFLTTRRRRMCDTDGKVRALDCPPTLTWIGCTCLCRDGAQTMQRLSSQHGGYVPNYQSVKQQRAQLKQCQASALVNLMMASRIVAARLLSPLHLCARTHMFPTRAGQNEARSMAAMCQISVRPAAANAAEAEPS